jgi:hypothetical protein
MRLPGAVQCPAIGLGNDARNNSQSPSKGHRLENWQELRPGSFSEIRILAIKFS